MDVTGLDVNRIPRHHSPPEAQLQATLNIVPAHAWYALPNGALTFVNERTADYLGLPKDHPLRYGKDTGADWDSHIPLLHPDDREETRRVWSECLRTGRSGEVSFRVRNAEGRYRWFLSRAEPVRAEDGTLLSWMGVNLEIEDQKRTEAELRRSQAHLTDAQSLSRTGSVGLKLTTKQLFWSEEAARIYGYAPGTEATADLVLQRVHPDDADLLKNVLERAAQGGSAFDFEHRLLMPDGSIKHLRSLSHSLIDEAGNEEAVGAIMDITERKVAEEMLRRSEAYQAEAQRLSHTGSFGWRPDSGEIIWSDETYRIFEYDRAEKPTLDMVMQRIDPQDRFPTHQVTERVSRTGEDFEHECRLLMPSGAIKHIHVRAHSVHHSSGSVEFIGAVTDITEHRSAEIKVEERTAELRRSERELRDVIDSIPAVVWSTLPDGSNTYVNKRFVEYSGASAEQTAGSGWEALIHPDDLEQHVGKWMEAVATGKPYENEVRSRRSDGQYRWQLDRGVPLRDAHGNIVKWYGVTTDIEDRKRAEDKVREQETELRQMLDLAPQLVAVFGPRRERLLVNRVALDYFGLTLEEWRDTAPGAVGHPIDSERVRAQWDHAMSSGSAFEIELRMRKGDGSYRWFLARFNPVRDDDGQILRWYSACTDIDDRKRAEERLREENVALREEIDRASMFEEIVGTSPALQTVLSRISKVAPTDSTVLITGETGTGKELVARAIHRRSRRAVRAFVSVNCAAIPRDLIASELFGHEKGAFTGAMQRRIGRFELAEGGTIFLDEVGELSADTQVALLRVLQEREIERVGGRQPIHVDVRVIAATNRDLKAAVASGAFRQDLYYRLNVFPLEVPPLRERRDDIPLLVGYFIDRFARKAGKNISSVDKKTLRLLQAYPWPGNIRELQNVIERSVIVCETENFSIDESWLSQQSREDRPGGDLQLSQKVAATEKEVIEAALRESQGRVFGPSGAAAKLGIARSTLDSKIQSLNINKNRFKAKPHT
jgi:formate hydrogenlyase transcriptional activator